MPFPPPPPPPPQSTWSAGPAPNRFGTAHSPRNSGQRYQRGHSNLHGPSYRGRGASDARHASFGRIQSRGHGERGQGAQFAGASRTKLDGHVEKGNGPANTFTQYAHASSTSSIAMSSGQRHSVTTSTFANGPFGSSSATHTRTAKGQAPPSVPIFGGPLPFESPVTSTSNGKIEVKREESVSNSLGLTPDFESYTTETAPNADEDEESKWAAGTAESGLSQHFQINYNGKLSTLNTPSEIAAWIEERKKRFPTKARIAEASSRGKEGNERSQIGKRTAKQRPQNGDAREHTGKRQRVDEKKPRVKLTGANAVAQEAVAKAMSKVDKLRRQLEKEQLKLSKISTQSSTSTDERQGMHSLKKIHKRTSLERNASSDHKDVDGRHPDASSPHDDSTDAFVRQETKESPDRHHLEQTPFEGPTLQKHAAVQAPHSASKATQSVADLTERCETPRDLKPKTGHPHSDQDLDLGSSGSDTLESDSDLSTTDTDDVTSSSGNSQSDSDHLSSHPEETSSKKPKIENAEPSSAPRPRRLCQFYIKSGRCKFGNACRYSHEKPGNRERRPGGGTMRDGSKGVQNRMSLHQRLVDQERLQSEQLLLEAILYLGDAGHLDAAPGH